MFRSFVMSERFLALLFDLFLGKSSLTQSLGGRVVYFDSTGAPAYNYAGVNFVECLLRYRWMFS